MRPADGLRARRSTAWWTAALLIIGTVATLNNTLARPTPTDAGTASFGSLPPARLFESRQGQPTIDGTQQAVGRRTAEQITTIQVAGRGGVPTDADAVVINLTAIRPTGNGYLTAFPCGGPVPQASTLNYTRNSVVANGATVKLTNGTLCIYTKRATHLVVDVNGYHPAGSSFGSLPPAWLFESRQGQPTIDGTQQAVGRRTAEQITTIQVAGRGGVPTDADAVVINLTAIRPTGNGYLTAFPCGGPVPQASTLNYTRNSVVANGATVKLTNGTLCIYTKRATHLVVDVNGYHPAGSSFGSLPPARLFESRQGQPTIDGTQQAAGRRTAEQITTIQVAGRGGVPTDADAVVINLTAIRPTGNGYLTAFPCGGPVPQASTLNYTRNSVVANGATVKLTNGTLCIYTKRATHLVVDVNGYHPGVAPPPPPTTTTTTTTTSTTLPPPSPPTVSA